jgi:hypothetical protein
MAGFGKLTPRMQRLVTALLTSRNLEEAAAAVGISPRTARRYRQMPEFERAFAEARRQVMDEATALLQKAGKTAVAILYGLMDSNKPSVSLRAAQLVLEFGMKSIDSNVAEELAALRADVQELLNERDH